MHVKITGAAGFIGSTLALRLLDRGDNVTGIDNLNDYYDVSLKEARLARLTPSKQFSFLKADISDQNEMRKLFAENHFDAVVNLSLIHI